MHNFDDMIEKYRRELIEFSKQASAFTIADDEQYRAVIDVMAQSEAAAPAPAPTVAAVPETPQTLITARVPFANYDDFLKNNQSEGSLRVQVFTGERSFPVSNAEVRISVDLADGEREIYSGATDEDGIVDDIRLPTPDSSLSFDENSRVEPYSVYDMRVTHPNFSPALFTGIPVFDSVKSIQPVELVPLSRNGDEPSRTLVSSQLMVLYGGEN